MSRVAFRLELHLAENLAEIERISARRVAQDADALGVDAYICERMADAPFDDVLAHLVMFAPDWLSARRWVVGWTAEPYDPLLGAYYCPDCGMALDDWRGHEDGCAHREDAEELEDPATLLAELAAGPAGEAEGEPCPADPDGQHCVGCGCDP